MESKEYFLKIDGGNKSILITGITTKAVTIDYSGDIDFTNLVIELTESIDDKKRLVSNSNNDTSEEGTLKLIIETIDSIIKEYNETIESLLSTVDAEKSEVEFNTNEDAPPLA